jgi:hypothetical protein
MRVAKHPAVNIKLFEISWRCEVVEWCINKGRARESK